MNQLGVGYEIKIVSNLLKRNIFKLVPHSETDEFTDMQGQILGFLFESRDRDMFQRDIEENFWIRRSTASRFLKVMEQRELICRESVPQDARLKKLILTPKAISIHEIIEQQIEMVERRITEGLTKEEIAQFHQIMAKIIKNLS